jgi:hypothetical protein
MTNWEHNIRTEEELKEIVRGVYDCKYFTSLHCENHMVGSIFMVAMFMGAPPSKPSFPTPVGDIRKDRKHKLLHFDDLDQWEKDMVEYENDTPKREEYFKNIGMLFEENSKAGPMAINGYPMFMSCQILSMDDTKRFIEMYNKYVKMREDFEKEWK